MHPLPFQSTHPRGVRRLKVAVYFRKQGISIHAPARGATQGSRGTGVANIISIHAPARGATKNIFPLYIVYQFQSTHPRGVRPAARRVSAGLASISIHAPARGATWTFICRTAMPLYFNPRTREGCDVVELQHDVRDLKFQSTHPRGVRLLAVGLPTAIVSDFNPRTREGCDCGFIQKNKRFSDIPLFFLLRRRSGRTLGAKTDVQAAYSAHACQAARPTNRRSGAQPPENARSSPRFRCEPLCDLMNASPSHYRMSGSSGRYACLQPKCSILLSYFFPR